MNEKDLKALAPVIGRGAAVEVLARYSLSELVCLDRPTLLGIARIGPRRADAILRRAEQDVRSAAKRHRISVTVGTTIREKGAYFNSALTFGPDGRRLGRYDKVHLTGVSRGTLDAAHYTGGAGKLLRPLTVAGVRVGVQICLDMRYPEPWRLLAVAGARLFLHATAAFGRDQLWKTEAVAGNLSSRCSENGCWMASANVAGPFQYVTSRIIDPDGLTVVSALPETEQVIAAAIDPEFKGQMGFLETRREDCYRLVRSGKR